MKKYIIGLIVVIGFTTNSYANDFSFLDSYNQIKGQKINDVSYNDVYLVDLEKKQIKYTNIGNVGDCKQLLLTTYSCILDNNEVQNYFEFKPVNKIDFDQQYNDNNNKINQYLEKKLKKLKLKLYKRIIKYPNLKKEYKIKWNNLIKDISEKFSMYLVYKKNIILENKDDSFIYFYDKNYQCKGKDGYYKIKYNGKVYCNLGVERTSNYLLSKQGYKQPIKRFISFVKEILKF